MISAQCVCACGQSPLLRGPFSRDESRRRVSPPRRVKGDGGVGPPHGRVSMRPPAAVCRRWRGEVPRRGRSRRGRRRRPESPGPDGLGWVRGVGGRWTKHSRRGAGAEPERSRIGAGPTADQVGDTVPHAGTETVVDGSGGRRRREPLRPGRSAARPGLARSVRRAPSASSITRADSDVGEAAVTAHAASRRGGPPRQAGGTRLRRLRS